MASPSLSVDVSLGTPTTGVNVSPQKVTVKGSTRRRSTLESSLRGVDLERPWCYLFINGYPTNDALAIKQESIDEDLKKLQHWMARFDPRPYVWKYDDTYKGGSRRADEQRIRTVFGTKRPNPTLIYLSGHTELPPHSPTDGPAYIPADHPTAPNKFIPYETMRQLLLKNPDSAPLLFITEVCYCSNFLRLPYELVHEGDSIQWKETGYPNIEGSSIVAHFAATSPDERARSFDNGAVFTKALYNIDPKVGMSVRGIAKELQGAINTIMATDEKNIQHPKIYCSQKTENPHFFKALGLFPPQDSDSSVGGDSDSNA